MEREVPEGFVELPEGLGFTDVLRPLYRREGDPPTIGMFVQEQHVNLINICHGGVIMTLADVAAAWGVNSARGEVAPAPTLNLGFDFIGAAREGDWLEARAAASGGRRPGRRFARRAVGHRHRETARRLLQRHGVLWRQGGGAIQRHFLPAGSGSLSVQLRPAGGLTGAQRGRLALVQHLREGACRVTQPAVAMIDAAQRALRRHSLYGQRHQRFLQHAAGQ